MKKTRAVTAKGKKRAAYQREYYSARRYEIKLKRVLGISYSKLTHEENEISREAVHL